MARIAGVDIPREKRVEVALTYIFGVGLTTSQKILKQTSISPDTRVKDLTEEQINRLREVVAQVGFTRFEVIPLGGSRRHQHRDRPDHADHEDGEEVRRLEVRLSEARQHAPDAAVQFDVLAQRAGMSTRNFARVFRRDVKLTPAGFVDAQPGPGGVHPFAVQTGIDRRARLSDVVRRRHRAGGSGGGGKKSKRNCSQRHRVVWSIRSHWI